MNINTILIVILAIIVIFILLNLRKNEVTNISVIENSTDGGNQNNSPPSVEFPPDPVLTTVPARENPLFFIPHKNSFTNEFEWSFNSNFLDIGDYYDSATLQSFSLTGCAYIPGFDFSGNDSATLNVMDFTGLKRVGYFDVG